MGILIKMSYPLDAPFKPAIISDNGNSYNQMFKSKRRFIMNRTLKTVSLGLLLSVPFVRGMEIPIGPTLDGASLLGIPHDLRDPVISHLCASHQSPMEAIKTLLYLRMTCTELNSYLSVEKLRTFIRQGSSKELETLFFEEAHKGDICNTSILLNLGVDINARNPEGESVLHNAVLSRSQAMVEFLIEKGADIDAQSAQGWTPLMWAAENNLVEMVRLLLRCNADTTLQNIDGNTALDIAQNLNHTGVIELL